jgi:hypothetical protein
MFSAISRSTVSRSSVAYARAFHSTPAAYKTVTEKVSETAQDVSVYDVFCWRYSLAFAGEYEARKDSREGHREGPKCNRGGEGESPYDSECHDALEPVLRLHHSIDRTDQEESRRGCDGRQPGMSNASKNLP